MIVEAGSSPRRRRRHAGTVPWYSYRGGQPLPPGDTFSRTSVALYRDVNGVWQSAAVGTLRTGHYDVNGINVTLREDTSQNIASASCNIDSTATYWGGNTDFTISTAPSCINGQTAYRHVNNNAGTFRGRYQAEGVFVNGQSDCCWFLVKQDATLPATSTVVAIFDVTVPGFLAEARFTWSTATIAMVTGTGNCGAIPQGNGWYLLWVTGTGVPVSAVTPGGAGNTRRSLIYPTDTTQNGQAIIIAMAQFEPNRVRPSSPIVTTTLAVTRSTDVWNTPNPYAPQAETQYFDLTDDGGAVLGVGELYGGMESNTSAAPRFIFYRNAADITGATTAYMNNNVDAAVTTGLTLVSNRGDEVERVGWLFPSGAVELLASINRGAVSDSGASSAPAHGLPAAWSATVLNIGVVSPQGGSMEIRRILRVRGNLTIPQLRAIP